MGQAIAGRLAHAGLLHALYNRTSSVCQTLATAFGVRACETIEDLAHSCQIIITTVSDAAAVRQIYEPPQGLLEFLRPDTLCIEMSTVGPEPVQRLGDELRSRGCALLDAPVSGSTQMAARGELTILLGGDARDLHRAQPILSALGRHAFHLGQLGAGATMKLAINNIVYGLNGSLAEALALAERSGIARHEAYEAIAHSAAAAPFVQYRRGLFEHPRAEPVQMRLQLAAKDLALIERLGDRLGVPLPQAAVNREVMRQAIAAGLGLEDVSIVAEHLRNHQTKEADHGRA